MSSILNDPTRSGPPLSVAPGKKLQLSRNEVESVCAKAARGAGMTWGLAEEAGYAAGWLVCQGYDGARILAQHLRSAQGKPWQDICPVVEHGQWRTATSGQPLCPIALGATLSDHQCVDTALLDSPGLRLGEVNSPALVLPFLAMMVGTLQQAIGLRHDQIAVNIAVDGTVSGDMPMLIAVDSGPLVITVNSPPTGRERVLPTNRTQPAAVDSEALGFLHELSMRITVPSSSISRARAGATGSDND